PYVRGAIFTRAVAALLSVFGPSLPVARIPALLAGCGVALVVFLWLRLSGERWAAWIAAALVCVDPILVQLSQIVRFYSLQHLAFLLGTIGVFVWVERRPPVPASVALLGASAAALALAFELQIVSLIGIGGLALFVVAALAPETA